MELPLSTRLLLWLICAPMPLYKRRPDILSHQFALLHNTPQLVLWANQASTSVSRVAMRISISLCANDTSNWYSLALRSNAEHSLNCQGATVFIRARTTSLRIVKLIQISAPTLVVRSVSLDILMPQCETPKLKVTLDLQGRRSCDLASCKCSA